MQQIISTIRHKTYTLLRKSERFFKTDMVYLAKGGFWLTLGQAVASISAFLLAIAFANLLPKDVYGTYKYVLSMFSILSIPTLAGINTALVQAVARGYEGTLLPALKIKLKFGAFGSIASLALAAYYYLNGNDTLTISFLIAAVFVPLFETFSIYGSFLNGKKLFKHSTQYYILSRVLSFMALIAALFFTTNIAVILIAYFLPWTILRIFFFVRTTRHFKPNPEEDPTTISYGKHLSAIGIFNNISTYLDNILLFHYLGAAQVATYAFALAPIEQIRALYKNLPTLAIPKLSNRSTEEINHLLYSRLFKLTTIGTIIAITYIVAAPYIFKLLFPKYLDAIFFSQLLSVILVFRLPLSFLVATVQSRINITPKRLLYWRAVPHIIFIGALFVLVPPYGIVGAAAGRIIFLFTTFATYAMQWRMLSKITN